MTKNQIKAELRSVAMFPDPWCAVQDDACVEMLQWNIPGEYVSMVDNEHIRMFFLIVAEAL